MKNERIGDMLKKYRKMNSMTVADVVAQLQDRYNLIVAEKTVYGWESDQSLPRTKSLLILCEMYQIDRLSDGLIPPPTTVSDFPITPDEMELIKQYRKHPEPPEVVHRVLNAP